MENEFGPAVRKALLEFVENGECSRFRIPEPDKPIVLKNDQVDISLTKSRYQPVVDWLQSLRPGVRNAAVKAVIRSAIANPAVFAYRTDSNIIIDASVSQVSAIGKNSQMHCSDAGVPALTATSFGEKPVATPAASQINKPQMQIEPNNMDDDDDFDLIGFDAFDNI